MRTLCSIFFFLLVTGSAKTQPVLRTVVPQLPVVVGESFQVQYVLEQANPGEYVIPPVFKDFRLVSGPAFYQGSIITMNGVRPLLNTVFTLEATRPGRFLVPGATVKSGEKTLNSEAQAVLVLSKQESVQKKEASSDYFLRQGEDVYRKIRDNLFLRVQVDKKDCFVGEPVVATFKLYSRLQSRSDSIKNPGFYGFSIYDLVSLSDRESTTENIGGKTFDVHTVRKVMLYPLQAGTLYIDEMEVRNRVEFSRSTVNRKTEQEIIEGMMGFPGDEPLSEGTEVFESEMHTDAIAIKVNPLPEVGKPTGFQGAVGKLEVEASISKIPKALNNKGEFTIIVRGQGNFIQIDAPRPAWPDGMEIFEPKVTDAFDHFSSPLKGERRFSYPFVVSKKGDFTIPALRFSYFDPDSGKYFADSTMRAEFSVNERGLLPVPLVGNPANRGPSVIYFIIGAALLTGLLFAVLYRQRIAKKSQKKIHANEETSLVDSLLQSPASVINDGNPEFYSRLLHAAWKFFEVKAGIAGSQMSKSALFQLLRSKDVNDILLADLGGIFDSCELGMFTGAEFRFDKKIILEKSREVFSQMEKLL